MKLAISGKGGVGKSTLAAVLALLMARNGKRVLAVDADPDANFASALGIPHDLQKTIVPISQQIALIEERTGAKVKSYGQMFRLNPNVADVADHCAFMYDNVALLVLGAIDRGGSGCACPESVFIRALVTDLILQKDDALIMDMEAGVEHLGRGTTRTVEALLVVTEPTVKSVDAAGQIAKLAGDLGITRIYGVVNKVRDGKGEPFLSRLSALGIAPLGIIPFDPAVQQAEEEGRPVYDLPGGEGVRARIEEIATALEEHLGPFGRHGKGGRS